MPRIRAVWPCDWPRWCKTSIVTICSLVSLAKGVPPSGLADPGQLGRPRHACRWMSSTTAVLDPCQARNDSGSLTPILTGLVTVVEGRAVEGTERVQVIRSHT